MPPRPPPHRRGPRGHGPRSSVGAFIDVARIDRVLARLVPSPEDRAFLLRCMLDEGPAHHRGANYALLAMLGELVEHLGVDRGEPPRGPSVAVPMRLPPHLEDEVEDGNYPLELPLGPIEALARSARESEAIVDCLIDGPPQHAVANVVMVALLDLALGAARARRP